jgi:hypothetical protein
MYNKNNYLIFVIFFLLLSCSKKEVVDITSKKTDVESKNDVILVSKSLLDEYRNVEQKEINPIVENYSPDPGSMCSFITSLYDSLGSYNSDSLWEQKKSAIEALLLLYFNTEKSLYVTNEKELPFITSVSSPDSNIIIYIWDQKVLSYPESFNGIIQYMTSSGRPYAVTIAEMNMLDYKYSNIYLLKNDIYLLHGENYGKGSIDQHVFVTLKINNGILTTYDSFHFNKQLLFSCDGLRPLQYTDSDPHIIDYAYNFDKEPYTITITYFQASNENLEAGKGSAVDENGVENKLELVFNGKEFIGDYSLLRQLIP